MPKDPLLWSFGVLFILALVALAVTYRPGTSGAGTQSARDPLHGSGRAAGDPAGSSQSSLPGARDDSKPGEDQGNGKPASGSGDRAQPRLDTSNPIRSQQQMAVALIAQGGELYREGRYDQACDAFRLAIEQDGENPLVHYLLALSLYQAGNADAARHSAQQGIALERQRPIENWGQLLSRYQGHPRLWLEQLRREAQGTARP